VKKAVEGKPSVPEGASSIPTASRATNTADDFRGGPHRDTSQPIGDGLDSHHCPAKNCYQDAPIGNADGPAVQMDPADHRMTSSYGSGAEAKAYRAEQQRLLNEGRVLEAIQMDIDDIRRIEVETGQPGKYDNAIQQMQDYADSLNPNDFIDQ
jgi:filamentous hemagglutinin